MRVLLAENHDAVRRGLRVLLESAGLIVVAEAVDGLDAIRLCEEQRPDLMILDIGMPRLSGVDVALRVHDLQHPPHVVMLGGHDDEAYVSQAIGAGARAYVLKSATDTDLIPAVRAVSAGKPFVSPAVSAVLAEDYACRLRQRALRDPYYLLSDREKEVLQLLINGRSNLEASELLRIDVSLVEAHRMRIMQRLDIHDAAEIMLYAVRRRLID